MLVAPKIVIVFKVKMVASYFALLLNALKPTEQVFHSSGLMKMQPNPEPDLTQDPSAKMVQFFIGYSGP